MAHATAQDMAVFFDERTIADLLSDSGDPVPDITSDPKMLALLQTAQGRLESALTVANMYTADDMDSLTGASESLMKSLECSLAMGMLLRRRPGSRYEEAYKPTVEEAEQFLDRLRKGERVFGEAEAQRNAGNVTVDGMTTVDYERLNLLRDRLPKYFISRARGLPTDRA